jgi:hypothetical protein
VIFIAALFRQSLAVFDDPDLPAQPRAGSVQGQGQVFDRDLDRPKRAVIGVDDRASAHLFDTPSPRPKPRPLTGCSVCNLNDSSSDRPANAMSV